MGAGKTWVFGSLSPHFEAPGSEQGSLGPGCQTLGSGLLWMGKGVSNSVLCLYS